MGRFDAIVLRPSNRSLFTFKRKEMQYTTTSTFDGCYDECQAPCADGCVDKAAKRKATPVFTGVLKYFPDALMEVARCSQAGNDQHHSDKPLHWDRSKSGDELDALARHLIGAGTIDDDGVRHSAKVAWRALANLQKELERAGEAENSPYNGEGPDLSELVSP